MTEINDSRNLEMEQSKIQDFVGRNKVWVNDSRTECGDGRYTKEQSKGALRAFGADFGFLMAVKGALKTKGINISSGQLIDKYFFAIKKVRGENTKFYFHTDSHHLENGIGCGHVAQASNLENDGEYGLISTKDVKELYYGVLGRNSEELHKTILEGDHQESAVLLIHGASDIDKPNWTVNSFDDKTDEMVFVVDIQRAGNFIKDLSRNLGIDGLESKDIEEAFTIQMQATAHLLARGKTQYAVNIKEDGTPTVTQLAKVQ